jgi:hypothetical protein
MLIEYLNTTVFKNGAEVRSEGRNNRKKPRKSVKSRIFLRKTQEVTALVDLLDA